VANFQMDSIDPTLADHADSHDDLIELQQTLYESRNPTRRWMHTERHEIVVGKLRHAAARHRGGVALEVGPGAGPYVPTLLELFDHVVVSDIEPDYLDHIGERFGATDRLDIVVDDIADPQLEPASFDVVLCSEVIEHTPDPGAVIRGIAQVLRPGGVLILSTPQTYSTVELIGRIAFRPGMLQLARVIYREPVLPTGHISLLTRSEVRELLLTSGFEIDSASVSTFYLPGIAEFGGERGMRLLRWLGSRLRRGWGSELLWTQHWTAIRTDNR
jgi:2-polyprenyl-3-methyl-5-hydroxy-6-metoxy-1,4-benzoquinol methylase